MNQTLREYNFITGQCLQIVQGDITAETVDAIVNAANSHLMHGSGVAGAIVRRGGPMIQIESDQWIREHGSVTHAEPAYTNAGNLLCRYVIHAVGPVWGEGDEQAKLASAIYGSLKLADKLSLGSIALPALSTGVFGFPKPLAAKVILSTITDYLSDNSASNIKLIRMVLSDEETLQTFLKAWEQNDHFRS